MRLATIAICFSLIACNGSPTEPRAVSIAEGIWTGDGACLGVVQQKSTLIVGCGHGEFPTPGLRSDGTFDADGTYRIEVGPVSTDPPPPAHYSGSLANATLTLRVAPMSGVVATYHLRLGASGTCGPRCL